ncbi:hypothetical protein POUND7_020079 [Theobroma cacao]
MRSLATTSLHYFIPYGVGAAASTRVSNELGARNPQAARVAVNVEMVLGVSEALIVSISLFSCRYVFGYMIQLRSNRFDQFLVITETMCTHTILYGVPCLCLFGMTSATISVSCEHQVWREEPGGSTLEPM